MSKSTSSSFELPRIVEPLDKVVRIAIMGGTFDPIHYGHLVIAEQAQTDLDLDFVVFMPAGIPNFKQHKHISSKEDRLAMVEQATADHTMFCVSSFELEREGITYTSETLTYLRAFYPPQVELYFIVGADSLLTLPTWHDAKTIAESATIVAAARPGYDLSEAKQSIKESKLPFEVIYIEAPCLDVSSTEIRERVSQNKSIRYLLPEDVRSYIQKNSLYQASNTEV